MFAKKGWATVNIEQRTSAQSKDDLHPGQSADIHILDAAVRDIWVDVKVITVPQGSYTGHSPSRKNKRSAYGYGPIILQEMYEEVRPFAVEQQGRLGDAIYALILETFRGATGPFPAGPTLLALTPSEPLRPDLIWTRFRPDLDLKSAFSGPNQVKIRSESGLGRGFQRGSVPEG